MQRRDEKKGKRLALDFSGALLLFFIAAFPVGTASAQNGRIGNLSQLPSSPLPSLNYFTDEDATEALPIRQRQHPGYETLGIRRGGFLFFPDLQVTPFYDSNIFASSSGEISDSGLIFSPALSVRSDFSRHSLALDFSLDHRQYLQQDSETHTDGQAVVSGRLDIRSDLVFLAAASAARRHEARSDSNSPTAAAEPVPYDEYDASMSLTKAFNRVQLALGVAVEHRNYHDVRQVGGGTVDQDFRDGEALFVGGRAVYSIRPGLGVFGDVRYNWRQYDNLPGANADSQGFNLLGGLEFTLTSLMRGEVGFGYMMQSYDGASDASGFSYAASVIWSPTALTTATFKGRRVVSESGIGVAAGRVDTDFKVALDYELRRNIIVSPSMGFEHQDFVGFSRTDMVFNPNLRIDYLINRYFTVGAEYDYTNRISNIGANEFDRHIVRVNAQAKF